VNAGKISFEIHKFAPLDRSLTSLLRGRFGPFGIHRFAPMHGGTELKKVNVRLIPLFAVACCPGGVSGCGLTGTASHVRPTPVTGADVRTRRDVTPVRPSGLRPQHADHIGLHCLRGYWAQKIRARVRAGALHKALAPTALRYEPPPTSLKPAVSSWARTSRGTLPGTATHSSSRALVAAT
jgi:hypothetical protein